MVHAHAFIQPPIQSSLICDLFSNHERDRSGSSMQPAPDSTATTFPSGKDTTGPEKPADPFADTTDTTSAVVANQHGMPALPLAMTTDGDGSSANAGDKRIPGVLLQRYLVSRVVLSVDDVQSLSPIYAADLHHQLLCMLLLQTTCRHEFHGV